MKKKPKSVIKYKDGIFAPTVQWYDIMREYQIDIPDDVRYNNNIAIFDFESSAKPLSASDGFCTQKTQYLSEQRPISFAMAHNIYGNDSLVEYYSQRKDDSEKACQKLVEKFYYTLVGWSESAIEHLFDKHAAFFEHVEEMVELEKESLEHYEKEEKDLEKKKKRSSIFSKS